ncbi:MAG: MXAN_2562 family outer membrane beta-barrel protein [Bradymonadaceae bacterium]
MTRRDVSSSPLMSGTVGWPALMAALAVAAATLMADASPASAESPVTGNIYVKLGPYYPSIDEEFAGEAKPFRESFGTDKRLLGQIAGEYYVFDDYGKLGVGVMAGYSSFTGKSEVQGGDGGNGGGDGGNGGGDGGNGGDSSDSGVNLTEETKFRVFPIALIASYRWDWLVEKFRIPLAPKVETGFDYYIWRVKDGAGNLSKTDGTEAAGGVPGFHVAARIEFLLDAIDPETAAAFDMSWGINNSYLFAEYNYANINGFGGDHFNLSDSTWKVGLAFEF